MSIVSLNPATGETLGEFATHTDSEVESKLSAAASRFRTWRAVPFVDRAELLRRAAGLLESEKRGWAKTMTLEMGKPVGAAVAEAEKCAWVCRYFADHAERFLAPQRGSTENETWVRFDPLGVVLAVMPWNFPFWQVFRFAAPTLMAGNVGLLKHASNVPGCALAIEEIFRRAGFPEGCFTALLVGAETVSRLLDDERVAAATLTGSEPAGSAVAARAGQRIKKTVLELGGSDPFVVLPSADLDAAVATAVRARVLNNGQSCIAAKRFVVHARIYDAFVERFVARMAALRIGDPMDPGTEVGPLATSAIRDARRAGGTIGGRRRALPPRWRRVRSARLVLPSDRSGRRARRLTGSTRGALRSGGHGDPGRGCGGGDRGRQRNALRARRGRMDPRRERARPPRRRAGGGRGFHQRHGRERSASSLRRGQTIRLRSRARRSSASASSST